MRTTLNGLLLASASLLALSAGMAAAQTIQLDPIVVKTPLDGVVVTTTKSSQPPTRPAAPSPQAADPAPETPSLPAIAATVFPTPTAISALSGSSAVERSQIDTQFQPDRISDVLRTIPGVTTSETARDTAQAINIRGLQDFGRVAVLIDGMRQNFQRSGHNANGVFYIEPEMVKRVDITRGPTATIYGSGAIGGVAAFEVIDADDILREGETVAMRFKGRHSSNGLGSFGSASAATRIGNFDIVGQLNGRDVDDYSDGAGNRIEASGERTGSALAKARWRSDGHQISGTYIDYQSNFIDAAASLNSTLLPANLTRRDSDLHNQQANIGYTFARPDTPLIDFSAKAYRNETDLDQFTLNTSNAGRRRGFNIVTEGFDVNNTSRFDWDAAKLALTYGGDGFHDTVFVFDQNVSAFSGSANTFTPNGERQVMGTFLQAHLKLWRMIDLIGAARYDTYSIEGGATSLEDAHLSPKATVGITPVAGITVFGTVAEGFRAPSVTETLVSGIHATSVPFRFLPNPNLRPEVAHNIEGGINLKFDGIFTRNDAFRAKVTVFENDVEDYIDGVGIDPPGSQCFGAGFPCLPGSTFQYVNIANATIRGIEVEAAYDAQVWFAGIGAHRIRGTDQDTGDPLLTIPADQITLTLGVRPFGNKLVAGGRNRLVAAQDRVPAGTPAADGFGLLDFFAQYNFSESLTFNANIDNVFDKQYRQHLDQSASPGLNARVGATVRFGAP